MDLTATRKFSNKSEMDLDSVSVKSSNNRCLKLKVNNSKLIF